jgi:serine/threonine protein kinase
MARYRRVSDDDSPLPLPEYLPPSPLSEEHDPRCSHIKTEAAKRYLADNWRKMFHEREERDARAVQFRERLRASSLSPKARKREVEKFSKVESRLTRFARVRPSIRDFEKLKIIGRGGSAVVWLVRDRIDAALYAMKIINKFSIIVNEQADSVNSERNVLASLENPWVVKLFYSFQDSENLYLVMEFVQGGDLLSLLSCTPVLDEAAARFYIAEIALAIQSVHALGFVHRDIKPDNILITTKGHIKLTDFGLATPFEKRDTGFRQVLEELKALLIGDGLPSPVDVGPRSRPRSIVGTVDYIAPEVLSQEEYDSRCDWWSLGIILYEMVLAVRPFSSGMMADTALKIVRWRNFLSFPTVPKLSEDIVDFIRKLLTDADQRMTFEQIRAHPFFAGFDWEHLEDATAPFLPNVRSPEDLSAFEAVEEESSEVSASSTMSEVREPDMLKYAFLGYTYKRPKHLSVTAKDVGFE